MKIENRIVLLIIGLLVLFPFIWTFMGFTHGDLKNLILDLASLGIVIFGSILVISIFCIGLGLIISALLGKDFFNYEKMERNE